MKPLVRISLLLGALLIAEYAGAATLQIPSTHPRLWYGNGARLSQAQQYFVQHPFTPFGSDATVLNTERALRGLLTGQDADCDLAVEYLVGWQVEDQGNFRDALRQQGEGLLLIYDWCHHRLTPQQISTLVTRWNGYLDTDNADGFANRGSEANNYFWGRLRNNLLWGIASHGENNRAQGFIDEALDLRLGQWFADWYGDFGRGGVFPEGGDYGVVMLSYPVLAFASAADFGFDPYVQTPFFREAHYAVIYGTTPGPTAITGEFSGGHLLFPFNDDENFRNGGVINQRNYLGDFARFFGQHNPSSGNARHMGAWLEKTDAGRSWMFDALGGTGVVSDLDALPLDYYAPGAQVFDVRSGHDAGAMQVHLQLGTPGGVEHRHLDGGSFQIWRAGRWLSRESVGYAEQISGFEGVGNVDTEHHLAHNGLLFQGRTTARWVGSGPVVIPPGEDRGDQPDGLPEVVRLQHHPQFGFVAVDLSDAYRNTNGRRVDWPYAERATREFLFLRQLHALLILDRMRASSDSQQAFYGTDDWVERNDPLALRIPAAQVLRTFVMHFETLPTVNGDHVVATVGNQQTDLRTLLPVGAIPRIVDEDTAGNAAAGQYRLELDASGTVENYFLHLIQGRTTGDAAFTSTLSDLPDRWSLQIVHPTRGTATVVLMKGMTSQGGSVSFDGQTAVPLNDIVQGITVTEDGPVWDSGDRMFADGFEN